MFSLARSPARVQNLSLPHTHTHALSHSSKQKQTKKSTRKYTHSFALSFSHSHTRTHSSKQKDVEEFAEYTAEKIIKFKGEFLYTSLLRKLLQETTKEVEPNDCKVTLPL